MESFLKGIIVVMYVPLSFICFMGAIDKTDPLMSFIVFVLYGAVSMLALRVWMYISKRYDDPWKNYRKGEV